MTPNHQEEPMSDKSAALTSVCTYGRHLMPLSLQSHYVRTDHCMLWVHLRHYLGLFGLRAAVSRVAGVPANKESAFSPEIIHTWPCGRETTDFTSMMCRIFGEKRTCDIVMPDEIAKRFAR